MLTSATGATDNRSSIWSTCLWASSASVSAESVLVEISATFVLPSVSETTNAARCSEKICTRTFGMDRPV